MKVNMQGCRGGGKGRAFRECPENGGFGRERRAAMEGWGGHGGRRPLAQRDGAGEGGRGFGRGRGGFSGFGDGPGGFGEGWGEGRGGRGGGGGGGRRRLFDNAGLRLLLLHLTAQEPRHGYDLIREIETLSGGAYVPSPGMVYPALTMMAEMEQIAEQPSEGTRKRFAVTPQGEAYLAEHAKERDEVLARLMSMAEAVVPHGDLAPVRRAMVNLKASLRIRLQKEGADQETILDIAGLIDEAAAKIERLK